MFNAGHFIGYCAHGCLGIRFAVPIPDSRFPIPDPDAMPATVACALSRSTAYDRRQPERTLRCRTVQAHLATWLSLQDDGSGASAPALTERECRRYLECGLIACGFVRASLERLLKYCAWPAFALERLRETRP